jgi:Spy/CpxP family protein refolding chaperone/ribosomal protein S20
MKNKLGISILIATLTAGALRQPVMAEEPSRATVAYGVIFLPLDFYAKHREALGLSEDQMHELQRIAEGMREPAQKLEGLMHERTKAMHEAISQNPIDPEKAMDRFQEVLKAENEMKALQFRARIAMRKVLTSEQFSKVGSIVKKAAAAQGGAASGEMREMFEQVRREIAKRSGGGAPPRELVEKLEQIEQAVKHGHEEEAKQQLKGILHQLREEHGSGEPAKAKRAEGSERPGAGIEQEMRKIAEAIEHTTDPEQRERLQKQMGKLRESQERARASSGGKRPDEGAAGAEGLEKRMREIAEAAKRTDNPERRERLQGALKALREATESGNREAIQDIMRAIEPVLREVSQAGVKRKE